MSKPPRIRLLPAAQIRPGENDRTVFNDAKLQELADSIQRDGLLQPITVRPRRRCSDPECAIPLHAGQSVCPACGASEPEKWFEIVAGERRFRACVLLGWAEIPAIVRRLTDEQASRAMLAENIHRADIDPVDEAQAYQKRMDAFGWSATQCARAAKVSEKRVRGRLLLLKLVPEAQHLIRTGQAGVQFGEFMSPLDANRQRIALQYLVKTEKPLLREFVAIVGKLLEEQSQESLFDLSGLAAQALDEHRAEHAAWRDRAGRFPVDERLPLMKRTGTIGLSFETYLHQLVSSGDAAQQAAAPIVGRVYQAMLETGMCYPPRRERHSPLEAGGGG